jgi:type I restriction enzyme, S subunit
MHEALGSLAQICYGRSPAEVLSIDGEIPVVGTGGVYAKAVRALFERGLVVARKGSLGTPHLMKRPFWPSDTTFAVLPNDGVDLDWLYFNLLGFDLTKLNEATGVPSISRDWLAKIRFVKPTTGEQQRIAAILTSLDKAIEATEALIDKHQQIKAGLMQDLFARGIGSNGVLRVAGGTHVFHPTRLGVLPTGWNVLSLQKCLGEGASNGIYKPPHLIGRGTLLIGQTALTEDRSVDSSLARRAVATQEEIRRFGLAAGDILVARVFATVEGVGRPALVPELGEPAVFESNMMRLRVAESIIRPRLMFEWLKSDVSRRYIEGRANASNQVSVNQGALYPLPVPVPPSDEQDRMVACIEAADRARAADISSLQKLRLQKQGVMHDLLTGKVRVPVPSPEAIA